MVVLALSWRETLQIMWVIGSEPWAEAPGAHDQVPRLRLFRLHFFYLLDQLGSYIALPQNFNAHVLT